MSVTPVKYTGSGVITSSDTHYVKYVGKTKSGVGIKIALPSAICLSNPDWAFAEKDDVVPEIELPGSTTTMILPQRSHRTLGHRDRRQLDFRRRRNPSRRRKILRRYKRLRRRLCRSHPRRRLFRRREGVP